MDTESKWFRGTYEMTTAYNEMVVQGAIPYHVNLGATYDGEAVLGKDKQGNDLSEQRTTTWSKPFKIGEYWYVANAAKKYPFTPEYIAYFDANFSELVPVDELPVVESDEV